MKLVFTNVNPHRRFNREKEVLIKLQLDNCFEMGWKPEDIILATNFDYEYKGVKSTIVGDENYCGLDDKRYAFKVSTHILTISYLFSQNFFQDNELYWYHDIDAYQQEIITEDELGLESVDLGLTDYGWNTKWNLGCFWFKKSAGDVITLLRDTIVGEKIPDERAMRMLVNEGRIDKKRYKKLNITYNFGMRHIKTMWDMADKPLKMVHFHPCYFDKDIPDTTMNMFRYGKNPTGKPLMNDRLIALFDRYYPHPFGTSCSYDQFLDHISYD